MKKKQTGKFMAMALTAAMLGGMLAGCGISSGTGEYACRGNTGCKRRAGDD